jgi:hypothetical protein
VKVERVPWSDGKHRTTYSGQAIHVFDRFHVMKKLNEKIDKVRAEEARRLKTQGHGEVLKHSCWCLLKNPSNLTDRQAITLTELVRLNLRSVRAYLMQEDFQRFWQYTSPTWAGKFLDQWCVRTMRSKIEPMKEMAGTLRQHTASTSHDIIELVSCSRCDSQRQCGRNEQQSQIGYQKSARIQIVLNARNRVISSTWTTRAINYPQIPLTSRIQKQKS